MSSAKEVVMAAASKEEEVRSYGDTIPAAAVQRAGQQLLHRPE